MRIGKGHIDMELLNLKNVMETLERYAQDVRNLYQDNLIRGDRISTGKLLNSVEYQVINNGVEYEVQLTLEKYWKYLEYGLNGSENPSSPFSNPGWKAYPFILDWIKVKPVLPRPNDNGRLPSPKSLAYLITRSIREKGTEPGNELQDALDQVNEAYKDKLVYALQQDLDVIMKVIVGQIRGDVPEY